MPNNEELTQTDILKHYLLEKENAYLLDENNNGKTIMLSGAWGSGKTHFWQNEIEPKLKEKLDNKACVYVSLYGKESLNDIKSDVYLSANGRNLLSTEVTTFGMETLSAIKDSDLAVGKVVKAGKSFIDSKKIQKGIAKLKKGGIICFDDFERKSKNVDLNDLFGFISQLAIKLECKVIIILNSDVFQDKEVEIFTNVKEKTISKFFHFNPSIEELYSLIANNTKYDELSEYKNNILSTIESIKEKNARVYTQVLDNCLEWIQNKHDPKFLKALILYSITFITNNLILKYKYSKSDFIDEVTHNILANTSKIKINTWEIFEKTFSQYVNSRSQGTSNMATPNIEQRLLYIKKNKDNLKAKIKILNFSSIQDISIEEYNKITNFIKSGILLP